MPYVLFPISEKLSHENTQKTLRTTQFI